MGDDEWKTFCCQELWHNTEASIGPDTNRSRYNDSGNGAAVRHTIQCGLSGSSLEAVVLDRP